MASAGFLSSSKAAALLGISVSTLYRMEEKGILNPIKTPGGQRRFQLEELQAYMESSKGITAPQKPYRDKGGEGGKRGRSPSRSAPEAGEKAERGVDPRNSLNNLTGTEWMPATKSYLMQKGLGARHPHAQIEKQHPAPFSFQDIRQLVTFFTKEGQLVLDPFGGVGSTAKACALSGRTCTQIELSPRWHELAVERLETEVGEGSSREHTFLRGDCVEILREMKPDSFDFVVTSPPYWAILNKKPDHKVKKERVNKKLATNYSDSGRDLGNIERYEDFLQVLVEDVFLRCARVLRPKKYMAVVVSDFRNRSEFISFHSDLIQRLNGRALEGGQALRLQGVKVLIQNHKSLLPYGYPYAYVENIHHQYILIFRKMK